jgi:RNA polymerase primary sigma factor
MRQLKIFKQITNRENQSLEKYFQEIGKISLITAQEEVDLTKRIKEGDQIALEKLTRGNLRFVVSVAKQYQNSGLTLNDLINEGNIGLIKAAKRFDETRGFKFISYAVWWIRQSILKAIGDKSKIIRIPSNQVGSLIKINRTISNLEQRFEREPTFEELSKVLKVNAAELAETVKAGIRHISINAPFSNEDENGLLDVLKDESQETPDFNLNNDSLRTEVRRSLSFLKKKELAVISLYFGLNDEGPLSLEDIGKKFNITRERVRQIKEKGISKLKAESKRKLLRSYLS